MKRNASLLLLELVIMLLVFALAAALCVQAFVWADSRSRQSEARDLALLQAQNAAEVLKSCGGELAKAASIYGGRAGDGWTVYYSQDWAITERPSAYRLEVRPASEQEPLLGRAELTVTDSGGQLLAQLTVCWQEDTP